MPVIWLIDAYRAGERGQLRALCDALAWPCELKRLRYNTTVVSPHLLGLTSIRGISLESRLQLRPPWPDLVVSSGVRNEPVCRWIRKQSGGRTRYVHIGRPWAKLESFDLVVTTPQYRVANHPNVLHNELTLHGVNRDVLQLAADRWRDVSLGMARPYTTVIVGGNSGPYTLGVKAAKRLAEELNARMQARPGGLLVTTSSRTSPQVIETLKQGLQVPNYFYAWKPDDKENNPYLGMLGLADEFIVSGDSIAMLSEACATGKPVSIFDLGGMREEMEYDRDFRVGATLYNWLLRWGWQVLSRDISLVHRRLVRGGRAKWLEDSDGGEHVPPPPSDDLARAVEAVRSLFDETEMEVAVE